MKKRLVPVIAALAIFLPGCINDNTPLTIEASIAAIMKANRVPGLAAVVVKNGETAWMQSFGYANYSTKTAFTTDTCLMLASLSKVFTGIALMQLHESGAFELDDDVSDYLPIEIRVPGYPSDPVTFRMLLTHTASIADGAAMDAFYNWSGDPTIALADCIAGYFTPSGAYYDAADNFYDKKPGTLYEYSNMGAALEGYLVEVISGRPFNEYCNSELFGRLSMDSTRWFLREYADAAVLASPHTGFYSPISNYGFADYPNGMLHSSIRDMANFATAVLAQGSFNGRQILSPETLQAMVTLQQPGLCPTQGLQFYQEEFRVTGGRILLWGHSGGEEGISTEMYFDVAENIGIVVLANGNAEVPEVVEELYEYALEL